jgi:DNA-3-methyladenine glycosylase
MAYVYLVYGMYHCLNVVTGPGGYPAALLIRAVEPLEGLAAMRAVRGRPGVSDARLAAGPGLVGIAFGITRADTGLDLVDLAGPLHLEGRPAGEPAPVILTGPRVGIGSAGEPWTSLPWRYAIGGSAALSRPIG